MTCEGTEKGKTEYLVYIVLAIIAVSILVVGIRTVLKSSEVSLKAMEESFIAEEKMDVCMKVLNVIPTPVAFIEYETATFSFANQAMVDFIKAYDVGLVGRPALDIVGDSQKAMVEQRLSKEKKILWQKEFTRVERTLVEMKRDDNTSANCHLIKLSEQIRNERFWILMVDPVSIKEIEK